MNNLSTIDPSQYENYALAVKKAATLARSMFPLWDHGDTYILRGYHSCKSEREPLQKSSYVPILEEGRELLTQKTPVYTSPVSQHLPMYLQYGNAGSVLLKCLDPLDNNLRERAQHDYNAVFTRLGFTVVQVDFTGSGERVIWQNGSDWSLLEYRRDRDGELLGTVNRTLHAAMSNLWFLRKPFLKTGGAA